MSKRGDRKRAKHRASQRRQPFKVKAKRPRSVTIKVPSASATGAGERP